MNADPLSDLRGWHVPQPVSWWPPAPGWWILAALMLVALAGAGLWWLHRKRRTARLRAAIAELEACRRAYAEDGDARRLAAAVSQVLRRLALVRYPRVETAGLVGEGWLQFLDRTGGDGAFSDGAGRALVDLVYRSDQRGATDLDAEQLLGLATRWVEANALEVAS